MKHQRYSIMATSNKGSLITSSLDEHYEILVRLVLFKFALEPEFFGIKGKALEMSYEPGLMKVGAQCLMTHEISKVMSRNKNMMTALSNICNHIRTKIHTTCLFDTIFQRKFYTVEFRDNLKKCIDLDIPLRH